uniref:Uncharacterized protein n=1 Tax=Trichobilharzia regenti TaxID=157069 RepID=A0AA85KHP8_TRIRE|nr:unnamed protein product [Trichobilharzia regenti]
MNTAVLLVCFFVIINLAVSDSTPQTSQKEAEELAKIKASAEFKDAKAKVLTVLSAKIDNYVLDSLRKKKVPTGQDF